VKWTKVALVLVIPALAFLLLGQSTRPPAAEAKPTDILMISQSACLAFGAGYDWNGDEVINPDDGVSLKFDCDNLETDGKVAIIADKLGGDSEDPKPADFAPMDRFGGQVHEKDGVFHVIAWVTNDDPVAFYTDQGHFVVQGGPASALCGPSANPDSKWQDEDCNGDGVTGDGAVVAMLTMEGTDPDRGPAMVRVRQGNVQLEKEYTVVGEPWDIELTANKKVIQTGAQSCALFTETRGYIASMDSAEQTPIIAKVTDSDGTVVTAAMVAITVDDEDKGTPARTMVPSLSSALGIVSPNVICGTVEPGTLKVTATLTDGMDLVGVSLDMQARQGKHASVEIEVKDPPTNMVLSASPGSLACDGTATSAVSATLTDAEKNPAVNGNAVHFDARALGIVSPMEPISLDGAAKTTLTPLSGMVNGVSVMASTVREPIDWDNLLHHFKALMNQKLLVKMETAGKVITWRNVLDECRDAEGGYDQPDDPDGKVNDGCPQVGGKSESGSDCSNRRDDDDDGAVNDGCPAVGEPETYLPRVEVDPLEGSLLVACSETLPGEAVPGLVPAAPVAPPAIAPPGTGDGGFLGP